MNSAVAGDLDEFDRMLQECDRIATESRGRERLALAAADRVTLALMRGDLDEADLLADEARQLSYLAGHFDVGMMDSARRLLIRTERDEFGLVVEQWSETLGKIPEFVYVRATLAWALAECGATDQALKELDTVLSQIPWSAETYSAELPGTVAHAALAAATVGDVAAAEKLHSMMRRWDGFVMGIPSVAYDGPAARFLGLMAMVLGNDDEAEHHFHDSEAMCQRMGAKSFLANNDVDFARLLIHRNQSDDQTRARTLLERSLTTAGRNGYRAVERHATELVAVLESG